ncbi:MAG: NAD(P)H-dependent oxidoreductase subunit E [Leptotrichiaceae bacterium]|jgi:NADH-quinone oxidoreductase subunit E|nr:NAD(P)H-dependent oxidoreductase subunit E [Leptotrichiaceae bacterium]MBP6168537.1 NAD(P)H-dependent oxidoreductase subunit E [Leptotrichiaceae bacterium]MBP7026918.1 NAD(P)H-dependent oxidoreductase subunit E [Leptotrichiaceae bacterium]MBP8637490.1 NAD(P)H-dependent oxidoreductase subunit E [Leptotrichiaceae bacterium]MBP9876629.1 NAD(P)H-dependent oxidoreductase subunit E [Leptotrichiaceae bacterium]
MQDIYESIDKFLTISEDKEDIFGILHFVQSKIGYIPNDVQQYIANKMNTSIENIKETIEISSHFVEEKTQNEILVCMGTTCSMKGSKFVFDEIQVTLKKKNVENVKLDIKKCFGACAYGVNVSVNGDLIHEVTADQTDNMIKKIVTE